MIHHHVEKSQTLVSSFKIPLQILNTHQLSNNEGASLF